MFKPDLTIEMDYVQGFHVKFAVEVTDINESGISGYYKLINDDHHRSAVHGLFTWKNMKTIIDDSVDCISEEDMNTHFMTNQEELLTCLRRAWRKLMPAKIADPWTHGMIEIVKDKHDPHIKLMGGTIEIRPCLVDIKSIGRVRQQCGFAISTTTCYGGDYWTPPGTDTVDLGEALNPMAAASMALTELWNIMRSNFFDHLGEERMAKESCEDSSC